jgi:hypothetical protein
LIWPWAEQQRIDLGIVRGCSEEEMPSELAILRDLTAAAALTGSAESIWPNH